MVTLTFMTNALESNKTPKTMDLLERLDLWLLKGFQRFSTWIYEWFSINNFQIARLLLTTGFLYFGTVEIWAGVNNTNYLTIAFLCTTGAVLLYYKIYLYYKFAEVAEGNGLDLLKESRERLLVLEIIFIVQSSMFYHDPLWPDMTNPEKFVYHFDAPAWFLMVLVGNYFASCKKPPKKKSRVKEMIERFVSLLRPEPTLVPS